MPDTNKLFLAVFLGGPSSPRMALWAKMSDAEGNQKQREGVAAWQAWFKSNETSIAGLGSPLGKTQRVSAQGIAATRNELSAYTVVRAASREAAAKLFENHPRFTIFPGEAVEVMECLPVLGQ